MLWRSRLVLAALALGGCVESMPVTLEDGSTAHDISCLAGHYDCRDEAMRLCGGTDYVILDRDQNIFLRRRSSMRVQCTQDFIAAHTQPPPRRSKDAACRGAYREIEPLAAAWARVRGGAPRSDVPQDEFMATCTALPVNAQLCLGAEYRGVSPQCPKVLGALDEDARARLDGVLLERDADQADQADQEEASK